MWRVRSTAVGSARTFHGEELAALFLAYEEDLANVATTEKLDLLE